MRTTASVIAALGLLGMAVVTPATAQPAPPVQWTKCPKEVEDSTAQCGHIDVPMRYNQPNGKKIQIGFVRVPAKTQARRGALFTNPGGPGGDAYAYAAGNILDFPKELNNEWDIIGVQPRGLPGSTALECAIPDVNDPGQIAKLTADSLFNAGGFNRSACQGDKPGYPETITTENTARDWEEVRRALGYQQVSILGVSYGTYLGSVYATLFPQHTDKVVLDSAMDPTRSWNGIAADQQAAYEKALNEYFAWVALNDAKYHMGNTPLKAYQYWSRKVSAQAGTNPTVTPPPARVGDLPAGLEFAGQAGADAMTAVGKTRVEGEGVISRMLNPGAVQAKSPLLQETRAMLPTPKMWDYLARSTNGTLTAEESKQPSKEEIQQAVDQMMAVEQLQAAQWCNENVVPGDPTLLPSFAWSQLTGDPFTFFNASRGSGWYCNGAGAVTGMAPLNGAALKTRPLQLSATRDPQTPYSGHGQLARRMGTQVVTIHGPGHAHFGTGNKVVDATVINYLRTGKADRTDAPGYWEAQ